MLQHFRESYKVKYSIEFKTVRNTMFKEELADVLGRN